MNVHLHFATRDLDASIAFYRTLLAVEPAKRFADYALFLTAAPGLELALHHERTVGPADDVHYGIAVASTSDVDAAIERLRAAKIAIDIERDETCCYAVQQKVWASDPDGRRWETYFVVAEVGSDDAECC